MKTVKVKKNATLYDIMYNGIELMARERYNEVVRITKDEMSDIRAARAAAKKTKATGFIVVVAGHRWNITTG